MELPIRNIDFIKDKEFVIECHCRINYACDSDWAVKDGYDAYATRWYSSQQPEEFFNVLIDSVNDNRNLAVVCEVENKNVGYLWVRFTDVPDYKYVIAEIEDIFIKDDWRNRGFAMQLIEYAERKCRSSGANILRSGTGITNVASIKLHERFGFKKYRVELEKLL